MGGVWYGFKVGIGVALAFAVIAAIAMLIRTEHKRRKSLLYGIRKIRRSQDEIDRCELFQMKEQMEKSVKEIKGRIKAAQTEEEKDVNRTILEWYMSEHWKDVNEIKAQRPLFKTKSKEELKEKLYESRRNRVGDEKWAEEKIKLDRDWAKIEKLL